MGNMVQSKNIGKDIMSRFKSLVGGELHAYTEMLSEARDESINRMIKEAEDLGADAIIGINMATSSVTEATSELLVYGTAVKFID